MEMKRHMHGMWESHEGATGDIFRNFCHLIHENKV